MFISPFLFLLLQSQMTVRTGRLWTLRLHNRTPTRLTTLGTTWTSATKSSREEVLLCVQRRPPSALWVREKKVSIIIILICARFTESDSCPDKKNQAISLGSFLNPPQMTKTGSDIRLVYTDGSICPGNNNTRIQTFLTLKCKPGILTTWWGRTGDDYWVIAEYFISLCTASAVCLAV